MALRHVRTLIDPATDRPIPRGGKFVPHKQVSYTKIGQNKGAPRLWLEGLRLKDCGFDPGSRFRVELDVVNRQVRLKIDPNGDRAVSQRQRNLAAGGVKVTPIVDVAGGGLALALGVGARVRATLSAGEIVFDMHPVDLAIEQRERRTRAQLAEGYLTEATICAGAGIATLALQEGIESEGIKTRVDFIVDREATYLQIAADNNPAITDNTRLYEASLEELDPEALTQASVLQLSLPCTGHSKSGKAKLKLEAAENHPTDALAVFGALKIIDAVQPSVLVSENIVDAKNSASYALLLAYLSEQGYDIFDEVYDGKQAGTIENRKRWYFVAISRGLSQGFSMDLVPDQPRKYATLGDALEHIDDDDERWKSYDYLVEKAVRDAANGKNFKRSLVTPEDTAIGCLGKGYSKARSTEAQLKRDVDAKTRLLTPIEHARVKGVPEVLIENVSSTRAHEVLGQSILYGHAHGIGQAIGRHFNNLKPVPKRGVLQGELAVTSAPAEDEDQPGIAP
ncbi:DNA cytosine methyltransferase [Xanthomonas arboricola]|uniref:DNA (cytosine-5-)-methyltransferase n=1 Tax=Xanthomonas arboricola TaxID=56448 RepID=A0AB73H297_9XANT|nr:DNA cytosine methyltransferase [Xanthomonas arboricola]MBB5672323.1 DNA (cytosine-5)-methyltransferase 1 [Xanthomonas arboricola]